MLNLPLLQFIVIVISAAKIEIKANKVIEKKPIDNTTMRIKAAGFEFNVTTTIRKKVHSQSLDSIPDFCEFVTIRSPNNRTSTNNLTENDSSNISALCDNNNIEEAATAASLARREPVEDCCKNNNDEQSSKKVILERKRSGGSGGNSLLKKSKSEGDPFRHDKKKAKKLGKIITYGDRNLLLVDGK